MNIFGNNNGRCPETSTCVVRAIDRAQHVKSSVVGYPATCHLPFAGAVLFPLEQIVSTPQEQRSSFSNSQCFNCNNRHSVIAGKQGDSSYTSNVHRIAPIAPSQKDLARSDWSDRRGAKRPTQQHPQDSSDASSTNVRSLRWSHISILFHLTAHPNGRSAVAHISKPSRPAHLKSKSEGLGRSTIGSQSCAGKN